MASKPSFVVTPELEKIRERGPKHHPMLPPETQLDEDSIPIYTPGLPLPAIDDKAEILKFLGLDGDMVTRILDEYTKLHAINPPQLLEKKQFTSRNKKFDSYTFPLVRRLRNIYLQRDAGDEYDPDVSYESYIRGGLTQGLRPEFALFCGLHESEDRYGEEFAEHFYTKTYQEHADDLVTTNTFVLEYLWKQKLQQEDKSEEKSTWPGIF